MSKALLLAAIIVLAGISMPQQRAVALEQSCRENNIRGDTPSGKLSIREFAILQRAIDCPLPREHLGDHFQADRKQIIFFWLRLEGDKTFLESVERSDEFSAILRRANDFAERDSELIIGNPHMGVGAALGEAEKNSNHFDWRFYAAAAAYLVPGTYTLELKFGGRSVCQISGPCNLSFRVTE